jgi:hypothetical protein
MGKADEIPVYFKVPSYYAVNDIRVKSLMIKTSGNEKMQVTTMSVVFADDRKLPSYLILNHKTVPNEQLPKVIIVRHQPKS